jgi:hypothetical protein
MVVYSAVISIGDNGFAINHEIGPSDYWRDKRGFQISIRKASLGQQLGPTLMTVIETKI